MKSKISKTFLLCLLSISLLASCNETTSLKSDSLSSDNTTSNTLSDTSNSSIDTSLTTSKDTTTIDTTSLEETSSSNEETTSSSEESTSESSSSLPLDKDDVVLNALDSKAIETTVAAISNMKQSDTTHLYRLKGIAQYPGNTKYGNLEFTDDTGTILIYGLSKNSSSLSYNGSSYSYQNDQSFSDIGLKAGDEVVIEGLYSWYAYSSSYGISEFMGYVNSYHKNYVSTIQGMDYPEADTYLNGDYYSTISYSLMGDNLILSLHDLMMNTHKTYVTYASLNTTLKSADGDGSNAYCFYTGKKLSSFNREHVWPQAKSNKLYGTSYAGSDIEHLRASDGTVNSKRGSAAFGPVFNKEHMKYYENVNGGKMYYGTGNSFGICEPADSMKGDVARIIAYVYVHYNSFSGGISKSGVTGTLDLTYVLGPSTIGDCAELLRLWNSLDPVSESEIKRNNLAYSIQGNRNPFIDHPSYLDRIFY